MCGVQTKWKESFYDDVEPIKLKDPLAVFLCIVGTATKKQEEQFREMWQERVRIVLFEEAKNLFTLKELK